MASILSTTATLIPVNVSSISKIFVLPQVSTSAGRVLIIKDVYGLSFINTITLSSSALNWFESTNISTLILKQNYGAWTLTNDGVNKWLLTDYYAGNSLPSTTSNFFSSYLQSGSPVYELGAYGLSPWGTQSSFIDSAAQWIWSTSNANTFYPYVSTSLSTINFNRVFTVSSNTPATIHCIFDYYGSLYINNQLKGTITQGGWSIPTYSRFPAYLTNGMNLIQVIGYGAPGTGLGAPSGMIMSVIRNSDNAVLMRTDSNWSYYGGPPLSILNTYSAIPFSVLYEIVGTLIFTPAGATGQYGPTLSQCIAAYSSYGTWVNNTSLFNMIQQGYQLWTVPKSAYYFIVCAGAQGGNNTPNSGGTGISQTAIVFLYAGQILSIMVGQQPPAVNNTLGGGGGGGATYIYNLTNATILLASGGGGGAYYDTNSYSSSYANAVILTSGQPGVRVFGGTAIFTNGGTGGGGGGSSPAAGGAAGGGGYSGNGVSSASELLTGQIGAGGGLSYLNGAIGGTASYYSGSYGSVGGFGGGGAGDDSYNRGGGGGGGYSGGGGGFGYGIGGGGGSYSSVDLLSLTTNTGNGFVNISYYTGYSLAPIGGAITLNSGITGTGGTVTITAATNVLGYTVYISTTTSIAQSVYSFTTLTAGSAVSFTSTPHLLPNTMYYALIIPYNGLRNGTTSYSTGVTTPLTPTGGAIVLNAGLTLTSGSVTISAANSATNYTVYISTTTSTAQSVYNFTTATTGSAVSFTPSPSLILITTYYAILLPSNASGNGIVSYSTGVMTPNVPTGGAVTLNSGLTPTSGSVTISASTSSTSVTYTVYISTTTSIAQSVYNFTTSTTGSPASFTPSPSLAVNTTYYAVVRPSNIYGNGAIFYSLDVLTPNVPTGGAITLNSGLTATSGSVTITAATSTVSVTYTVYISTTISSAQSVYNFTTTTTGSAVSFTPSPSLTANTTYYAVVVPSNAYGNGLASYSTAVTTPATPVGGSIVLNSGLTITSGSVTITAATGATGYTVYISTTTSAAQSVFNFVTAITGSAVSFAVTTNLSSSTTYYAVLVPYNGGGNGTTSFSTGVTTPAPVVTGLYTYTSPITFSPAGATGRNGPTLSQCTTSYSSYGTWVSNTSYFNMTTAGYQRWTVPTTGTYTFVCAGAKGGNGLNTTGGTGITQTATFSLTQGHILSMVIGQLGGNGTSTNNNQHGGGGGASYIYNVTTSTLLMVSGGGGGANSLNSTPAFTNYANAVISNNGQPGIYNGSSGATVLTNGGTSGNGGGCGGGVFSTTTGGGGGGGYTGNGVTCSYSSCTGPGGGLSYTNGATGGINATDSGPGGFGGGAGGSYCGWSGGGAGGGYSGGGGGTFNGVGGGGGSFSSVTTSSTGTNSGQGYVIATIPAAAPSTPPTPTPVPTGGIITLNAGLTISSGSVTITAATNATNYTVYISTTTSTAQSVYNFATATTGSAVSFTPSPSLTANTTYYAVMIPSNTNGSGTTSFSSGIATPALPTGGSIVLNSGLSITSGSVTISAASGATGYTVYISTTTSTAQSVYNFTTATTGSAVSFTPSPSLTIGTTYYAVVVPYNSSGNGSASFSSGVSTFTTPPTGGAITLNAGLAITSGSVTITAATGATNYTVYISTTISSAQSVYNFTTATTGSAVSFTPSPSLTIGTTYYAVVVPSNTYGNGSTSYSTGVATPALPTGGSITLNSGLTATSGSVTITAATSTVSVTYTVYISTTISSAQSVYNFTTATTGSAVSFTPSPSLTPNTTYYAVVVPYNSSGNGSSSYSTGVTTPATPVGGSIVLNSGLTITTGSVTITAATGATGYTVYISTTTSAAQSVFNFVTAITGSAVSFAVTTNLTGTTTYYAVLVPYNAGGNGTTSFSTGVTTPAAPSGLYTYTSPITFSPAGATGRTGPILSQCTTTYSSYGTWVSNTSYFNMTTQGIQQWTVPTTGSYTFDVTGGGGANLASGRVGYGARLQFSISLTQGTVINIIVGQIAPTPNANLYFGSGGGGGSFVYTGALRSGTLICAAGGAGGTGALQSYTAGFSGNPSATGMHGNTGTSGGAGLNGTRWNGNPGPGGTSGGGGQASASGQSGQETSGGGAGWLQDAQTNPNLATKSPGTYGTLPIGGANSYNSTFDGGFGGGGGGGFPAGTTNYQGAGGGGGYSGGGAGGWGTGAGGPGTPNACESGGGGGSFISASASATTLTSGYQTGNGYVTVTVPAGTPPAATPVPTGGIIALNAGLTTTSGSVTITAATNATNYTVYISTTTSTAQSVYNFTTATTGSAVSFTPSPSLTIGTTYYAVMIPSNTNGNGSTSFSSGLSTFTTPPTGGAITLNAGLATTSGSVTIIAATGATNYTVYISTTISSAQSVYNFTTATTGSAVSFTPSPSLTANTTYYAVVVPSNTYGNGSTSYSTGVATPALPTGGSITLNSGLSITSGSVTITAASGATNYTVYISTTISSAQSVYNFTTATTGSAVSFTPSPSLTVNTTYYAVVVPSNGGGNGSASYSTGVTTPSTPVGGSIVLNSGLTTTSGSVTITAASGATGYTVYISTTISSAQSVYNFTTATTGSAVSFTPSPSLTGGTTYYAVVVPYNGGGNGSASYSTGVTTPTPPETPLYTFTTATYNTGGATERNGPTLSQARTGMTGTPAPSNWNTNTAYFNMTTAGIQLWTVPSTRNYTIVVAGAQGAGTTKGLGRIIQATLALTKGAIIKILVGQTGGSNGGTAGGGGGGTFVATNANEPIVVAGGGGGSGDNGVLGSTVIDGNYSQGNDQTGISGLYSSPGASFSNNADDTINGASIAAALSFVNGGTGAGGGNGGTTGVGGFGGAGGTCACSGGSGGGGGGYQGGDCNGFFTYYTGSGGYSFYDGRFVRTTSVSNAGTNAGQGYVTITAGTDSVGFIDLNYDLTTSGGSVRITPATSVINYTVYISTTTSSAQSVYSFATTTTGSWVSFSTTLTANTTYYAILSPNNSYSAGVATPAANALYIFTGTLTFTPAGKKGQYGPTLSQCRTAYYSYGALATNTAYFNMTTQGIQRWTVPVTRNYVITCAGSGYTLRSSTSTSILYGAVLTATFSLTQGDILCILVGQKGADVYASGGGGSGGSFVLTSTGTPLIVAGGSGSGSSSSANASLTTTGGSGTNGVAYGTGPSTGASGGSSGSGGGAAGGDFYSLTSFSVYLRGGSGGGGLTGNGTGACTGYGGLSYTNGGAGATNAGFGGGGSSGGNSTSSYVCGNYGFGGGGGYSGGGGGGVGGSGQGNGGGGGSYSSVTLTSSSVTNANDGYVTIT